MQSKPYYHKSLIPCPWCNQKPMISSNTSLYNDSKYLYTVGCSDFWKTPSQSVCILSPGTIRAGATEKEAIQTWNARMYNQPLEPTSESR